MKRVVVVDDDPDLGPAIRDVIGSREVRVETPGDAQAALPLILKQAPDLVILDVNMPGMSGWEFCAILRRQSSTRALPILFLTGRHEVKDRITAMQFGGSDFLAKPFSVEELRSKVGMLLSKKRGSEAG
jgi:DNA-binding response OmpR family regulator